MTGQGGPWTAKRRREVGRRLLKARLEMPVICLGGSKCFLSKRGLPPCERISHTSANCSVRRAESSPDMWSRIEKLASNGNPNAIMIVGFARNQRTHKR